MPPSQTETATATPTTAGAEAARPEWTVDELARLAGLPVRTIREYQTLGILPAPRRQGRVGLYGDGHLRRLQLVARLRDRGYSLAGIRDLLGSWSAGADLAGVLALEPDELVHVDEPGAPITLEQLRALLPEIVPDHLSALEATGVIERCGPGQLCVPSPSLLQLAIEALGAGLAPADVLALLGAVKRAADLVADEVVHRIWQLPPETDASSAAAFLRRGRGLLSHGVGRLTLHRVGRRLGITDEAEVEPVVRRLVELRGEPA